MKVEAAAKKARAPEKRKRKRDEQEEALANAVALPIVVEGNLWRRRREEAESSSACNDTIDWVSKVLKTLVVRALNEILIYISSSWQ